jgi:prephenate dehydrogenase
VGTADPFVGRDAQKRVDAFVTASFRVWTEIAQADPQPWKKILALMTEQWMRYRRR